MPTLYLIDGHAQFYRAYHAIRSGMASPVTKEPTNLTFGFVGMLLKVLREYQPDYLAVVIDVSGDRESFRSQLFPEYKATRKPSPDDFHPQVERCLRVMGQMHIPVIGQAGVEADDVIATIVRRLRRERPELHIRIISRDKDLTQLLDDHVELFDVHKDQAVTAADVFEAPGVKPEHVVDILTLMGDTVDNIPGVAGVGPKTASQLILQYGSVDNLLAHLEEIKGKRRLSLEAARDLLPLSRRLVTLKDDVPLEFELESSRSDRRALPVEELTATFRELGFNRYQQDLRALTGAELPADSAERSSTEPEPTPAMRAGRPSTEPFADGLFSQREAGPALAPRADLGRYRCIGTIEQLDALVAEIRAAREVTFDTETDGLEVVSAELCGVAIALEPRVAAYIPVCSPTPECHLDLEVVINRLRPVLEDPAIAKVGHNLKFDINVMRRCGVRVEAGTSGFDTMIASYVIDAARSSHGLDVLALAILRHTNIPITDLIGSGKAQKTFDEVQIEVATEYSAEDADVSLRLRDAMKPQLEAMGLMKLFREVEMPLVDVLAELEWNGIRVDPDELERQRQQLEGEVGQLRRRINDAAPVPFNPDSPRQLAAVLFNKPDQEPPGLGLRATKRGKTGPSTDQEVLDRLAADAAITSELPRLIVEYRQFTKLVNTYLVALKDAINPATGRVHASFNQTVAATGRLSSSDPNLQNIPIRTDVGREIRRAFVADPSHALLAADYSQIELRILAHLADDPALIEAFRQGQDIHTAVAAEVFGVPLDEVTAAHRNSAKMVNFGIVYGITAFGLARRLTAGGAPTSNEQASRIILDYKARFSRIDAFLDQCVRMAQERGYVETMLGRRRAIPQIYDRNPAQRQLAERMAINSVVQGSAADLIKLAMIDIHRSIAAARRADPVPDSDAWASPQEREALATTRMVLQIHDELVFEVPREHIEFVQRFVVDRMQRAMTLKVPLAVGSAWSTNWIDAK